MGAVCCKLNVHFIKIESHSRSRTLSARSWQKLVGAPAVTEYVWNWHVFPGRNSMPVNSSVRTEAGAFALDSRSPQRLSPNL